MTAIRNVAERHGLPPTCVWRHARQHLPETLLAAARESESVRGERLMAGVLDLRDRVARAIDRAESVNDDAAMLRAIAEARKVVELLARLAGTLSQEVAVTVNVTESKEWIALTGRMLSALRAHPEARQALVEALETRSGV